MELQTRLTEDMKVAMKAGQKDRLQVIRMLLSEVKNVDLNPAKPTPQQAVEAYAKKLRKAAEEYQQMGRGEEVAKLKAELEVVEGYLPKKAGEAETAALVDAFLASSAYTEKQMGQAMGAFMKQHGAGVDPGIANRLLKARLTGR
jgi:uncharacterized protein YqeY